MNFLPRSVPEISGCTKLYIKEDVLRVLALRIEQTNAIPDLRYQMGTIIGCASRYGLTGTQISDTFVFDMLDKISNEIYGEIAELLKSRIGSSPANLDLVYKTISLVTSEKDKPRCYEARDSFTKNFGWAIPSPEAIDSIVRFAGSEQILEVGSGLGLWAGLVRAHGGSIRPVDTFESHGTSPHATFVLTEEIGGVAAIQKYNPKVLMMCWPGYDESFASQVLEAFETYASPDARFIYIGEGQGGCNADDMFFQMLDQSWDLVERIEIPQWWGIHDCLNLYRRKAPSLEKGQAQAQPVEEPWITVESRRSKSKR